MARPSSSQVTSPDAPGSAARSDIGRQRTGNEDRYLARPPVFAVADGMGGHQAGEVASGIAIDLLGEVADQATVTSADEIVEAIERANAAIRREARQRADLAGMGTTCTVALVGSAIDVAHVGDSRAYLFRDQRLVQLTDDHSLVASMVREGLLDPSDAATDGRRNIITRALGAEDEVRVDRVTVDRAPGDRLLVSSDGLHGQVEDAAIAAVLRDERDPGAAADRLVALANAAGGDDNVTVIVVDLDAVDDARSASTSATADVSADQAGAARRRPGRRTAILLILLILALVLIALAVAAGIWLGSTVPA
jgi:protein phosphatase